MKDEGFVPGAWPDTFILHASSFGFYYTSSRNDTRT